MSAEEPWRRELESARASKDAWFRHGHDAPVPHALREKFAGLAYYPPNPALRLRLELTRSSKRETVQIAASTGPPRTYEKYGWFDFAVDGQPCRLWAYRSATHPDLLFVPFRDATSGKETYGAGRYLDLHVAADDAYLLDFNEAYNPYCAYSPDYSCPLTPPENWLRVAIRAGEKEFPLKGELDALGLTGEPES